MNHPVTNFATSSHTDCVLSASAPAEPPGVLIGCKRFAAEQLRLAALTPALALPVITLSAILDRSILGLVWIALLLFAKALQLLICRRLLRASQTSHAHHSPFRFCDIAAVQIALMFVWASALWLIWDVSNIQIKAAVAAILATLLTVDITTAFRSLRHAEAIASNSPAGPAREDAVPVRQLGLEAIRPLSGISARRGVKLSADADLDLPHLVGDRAALQRLWRTLVANVLKHAPENSPVSLYGALNETGGIRLTVSYDGRPLSNRELLAGLTEPLRRYGATLTCREFTGDRSSAAILDFPAARTVDTTPVERRPLIRPTTGQRLLMTLTR